MRGEIKGAKKNTLSYVSAMIVWVTVVIEKVFKGRVVVMAEEIQTQSCFSSSPGYK